MTTANGIRSPTILAEPRELQCVQMAPATAAMEHMEDGEKCVYCIWIELRAGRGNWIKTFVFINGF